MNDPLGRRSRCFALIKNRDQISLVAEARETGPDMERRVKTQARDHNAWVRRVDTVVQRAARAKPKSLESTVISLAQSITTIAHVVELFVERQGLSETLDTATSTLATTFSLVKYSEVSRRRRRKDHDDGEELLSARTARRRALQRPAPKSVSLVYRWWEGFRERLE
ncbi:hypothetical protein LTS18_007529 [Coniosporium uncinatum]|uniref:Uncharacterized protein n=1 Tax=Coniosporium uncinatum TaxID=93489 RepID=A0ACC3DX17_9PEZI|nr:hypothetical protein LTS18_007529 [Coniosporium uncinatum]